MTLAECLRCHIVLPHEAIKSKLLCGTWLLPDPARGAKKVGQQRDAGGVPPLSYCALARSNQIKTSLRHLAPTQPRRRREKDRGSSVTLAECLRCHIVLPHKAIKSKLLCGTWLLPSPVGDAKKVGKQRDAAPILRSRAKQSNQGFSAALGPYPAPSETRKRSGKNLVFPREPAAASPTGMMVISALGRNNTPPMPKIPSWDFRQPSPQRRLWLICSTIGEYTGGRTHPPQSGRSYRPHNRRRPARPPPARRSAYNRWADRRRSPKNAGRAG